MMRFTACVVILFASAAAFARPRVSLDVRRSPTDAPTGRVCSTGPVRCETHVRTTDAGDIVANAAPTGFGPIDLQSAYAIDPNIATTPTVAIVDAYGYPNLASDLATYRSTYGLPACTQATGCLTILNENGATTPLPPPPPPNDDWTIETALDVDMVSAACPRCKIVVVQGTTPSMDDLGSAQNAAAAAGAAVISDSFGAPQPAPAAGTTDMVPIWNAEYWTHAGIAQFVSTGDSGYNNVPNSGPTFPSISDHVIAVGGTALTRATNPRGWSEAAWTMGGSSCAYEIAKPAYQPVNSGCLLRATSDISAVADPNTGVAIYNAGAGGWIEVGGTSAASPLVASLFASIGRGNATALDVAQAANVLHDVTTGSNGSCGTLMCNAATGWDGPTGFGTPDASKLAAGSTGGGAPTIQITSPSDGATVAAGFEVDVTVSEAAQVALAVDGVEVDATAMSPYALHAPAELTAGPHEVVVVAVDAQGQGATATIRVNVADGSSGGGGGGGMGPGGSNGDQVPQLSGGCAATGGAGLPLLLAFAFIRRRRRV